MRKTFPCPKFGFIYNSKTDLNRHMLGMHTKINQMPGRALQKHELVASSNSPSVLTEQEQKEQKNLKPIPEKVFETILKMTEEADQSPVDTAKKQ